MDSSPERGMKAIADAPIMSMSAVELEVRERELQALDRLMRQAPGAITNARGTRRLVHRPGSLIAVAGRIDNTEGETE